MMVAAQKTRAERHRCEFRLIVDDGTSFFAGRVRDVSETGLYLETSETLPVDQDVSIYGTEEHATDIFGVRARVVRSVPEDTEFARSGGIPFRFDDPTALNVEALVKAIREWEAERDLDPLLGARVPKTSTRSLRPLYI